MGTADFEIAFARGEPLADVTVTFREGVDGVEATSRLNSLAEDFHLHPQPHYDVPGMRIATATRAALERLFGWRIERERTPGGTGYWWATVAAPIRYPAGCESLIESMDLAQPGADDDGQWFEWSDEQRCNDGSGSEF
ncbi:MAG: hypothetical protein KDB14_30225 [Planctomycetales bacterium]|nr:hypothetical protein [Planctomycetales bacterium]